MSRRQRSLGPVRHPIFEIRQSHERRHGGPFLGSKALPESAEAIHASPEREYLSGFWSNCGGRALAIPKSWGLTRHFIASS